ncbi:MAG: FAD/NAD(P)-binding protein [Phycisphaerales bacterium]|nr:FAD/NAD(P)-binding protein [Phycisphaerales bacterium]
MASPGRDIVIVGVGPRGTYAFERLVAVMRDNPVEMPITIHLVDSHEPGAGQVYATTQAEYLLMNTVADQVTAFVDDSVTSAGPKVEGPTLAQWLERRGEKTGPGGYPSRAQHGRYLSWVVKRCIERLPPFAEVRIHRAMALDVVDNPQGRIVILNSGDQIRADKILLTTGNVGKQRSQPKLVRGLDTPGDVIQFVANPYPICEAAEALTDCRFVGVRGLGLTTVDVILALTIGRGGRFVYGASDVLEYETSGREPKIFAWSRSGRPLGARGRNEKGPTGRYVSRFLTNDHIDALFAKKGRLNFKTDLLPHVLRDMACAFYSALHGPTFADKFEQAVHSDRLEEFFESNPPAQRFSFEALTDPVDFRRDTFDDRKAFREVLLKFLADDLAEAKKGNVSGPVKSACDVLRDIRDNIRHAVEFGLLTPGSQRYLIEAFGPINNRLAVGPPAFRIEQLRALTSAGILDMFWGPDPEVVFDAERREVLLRSRAFKEQCSARLDGLVDARVPCVPSTLIERLLHRNTVRRAVNRFEGEEYQLDTIEIDRRGRVINGTGKADPNISALGPLTEGTVWYTQAAARPGVNSRSLTDAGRWAMDTVESLRVGAPV